MSFIRKSFSQLCLAISLLLIIYTFYKSEIVWNGENRSFYLIYYIVSFTAIIFSIISFFMSEKIKNYLIIIFISIGISLYSFEIYLKFFNNPIQVNKIEIYEKKTGKRYDTRSKIKIYNDLKEKDENIKMMTYPTLLLGKNSKIFPLANISHSKTIYCNENGYYSIYESDRYGFNNPDEEWDQTEVEYILIGDSFVHGACVNRPNDISSVLRNLTNKSVLNLGFGDNGPLLEYATLREYLLPKTKKVLWVYFEGNDLINLNDTLPNKILSNYLNDLEYTQNLKNKQSDIDKIVNQIIEIETKKKMKDEKKSNLSLFKKIIKLYYTRTLIFDLKREKPKIKPEFKKILELANNLVLDNNSKLYFIYLPEYSRYKKNYDNSNYIKIKKIINELSIPFIDIHTEVFKKHENPLIFFPFEEPGHYSVYGYKKIAEKIFELSK